MAKEIDTDKLAVNTLFERWFRVPEYQRPYVWEDDNIVELLEDIATAQIEDEDNEYFLGSLVFNIKDGYSKNQKFKEYDLLDGQQRLTTLFLLIAIGRDRTNDATLKDTCSKYIYQKENKFKGVPERIRIEYDIREDVKDFVNEYIKNEGNTLKIKELKDISNDKNRDKNIKNMANAILVIHNYFEENNISLMDYYTYLFNKVSLVYVASEDLDNAFKLFTVLNDRGIKLRSSDILKATNLKEVNENERKKYAIMWEDLENQFDDYFDNFLSHIRTILVKTKARKNLLDEYEELIYKKGILEKGKDTFELVKKYKDIYNTVLENSYYDKFRDYETDNIITIMKETFPSDIWIPPLLKYYDKYGFENIDVFIKKVNKKASYEWILQYTPTRRIENMNSIIKIIEESESSEAVLEHDALNVFDLDKLKQILNEDIYGRRFAKYILYKLEFLRGGDNQKLNIPKHISVEHVLPQTPNEESQWMKDFTAEEREIWTNRIGNLVLLSRIKNSSLNRLDFEEKKKRYFKKSIEVFPCISKIMQNDSWTIDKLKSNHDDQIKLLLDYYSKS